MSFGTALQGWRNANIKPMNFNLWLVVKFCICWWKEQLWRNVDVIVALFLDPNLHWGLRLLGAGCRMNISPTSKCFAELFQVFFYYFIFYFCYLDGQKSSTFLGGVNLLLFIMDVFFILCIWWNFSKINQRLANQVFGVSCVSTKRSEDFSLI